MAKRKGSQMSRLERSQNAHRRLRNKLIHKKGKSAEVKFMYHSEVMDVQKSAGRILPLESRRMIFQSIEKGI